MEDGREIGREVRVERNDLRDVAVDLLNKSHVLHHVIGEPRLVVLVDLLDQSSVAIEHRLNLVEAGVEGLPRLAFFFFFMVDGFAFGFV